MVRRSRRSRPTRWSPVRESIAEGDGRCVPRRRRSRSTNPPATTKSTPDQPVDRHRLERPHQPHVLRRVRVPEAVRLQQGEGDDPHARRAPQGPGGRVERARGRRPSSTCSACTSTASGPRCSRTSERAERVHRRHGVSFAATRRTAHWRHPTRRSRTSTADGPEAPVSFFHRGRVRRTRKGMYRLDIPEAERAVLRAPAAPAPHRAHRRGAARPPGPAPVPAGLHRRRCGRRRVPAAHAGGPRGLPPGGPRHGGGLARRQRSSPRTSSWRGWAR